jgi:vitamin B12 transporter
MPRGRFLGFVVAAAWASFAHATSSSTTTTEPEPHRESIVVTASRLAEDAREAPASTTVLERDLLDSPGFGAAAETLRLVPGLEVSQSGGPGRVTSVLMRGANSAHTLVLLDGQRLNDPATGLFDFAALRTAELDRIEVVRGPQSALWGSEALGGVIHLISHSPEPGWKAAGAAGLGQGSVRSAGASLGFGDLRWSGRLALDHEQGEEISVAEEGAGNSELDRHRGLQASARLEANPSSRDRVRLTWRALDATTELDGFDFLSGPVDDLNAEQDRRLETLGLHWSHQRRTVTIATRLGFFEDHLHGRDPDTFFNNFEITSSTPDAAVQIDRSAGDAVSSLGLSWERREVDNRNTFSDSQRLAGLFLQHRFGLGACTTTVGGRYDDHQSFGSTTTGRLAVACPLGKWTARAAWGSGFRAPSLNELVFPFFGNPELEPEKSRGGDLGLTFSDGRLEVSAALFHQDFEDLIGVGPAFTAVNIGRARTRGVEAGVRLGWDRGRVSGNYTYLEAEDRSTSAPLPRRPRHRATAVFELEPAPRWQATATVIGVADRVDVGATALDDYVRVDLGLRWRATQRVELDLAIHNSLDEDYQEISGYGTAGRLLHVGARLSW